MWFARVSHQTLLWAAACARLLIILNDDYHMAGNFGGANFCGKSEKALRINFRGFKFHGDSNQSRGVALHKR